MHKAVQADTRSPTRCAAKWTRSGPRCTRCPRVIQRRCAVVQRSVHKAIHADTRCPTRCAARWTRSGPRCTRCPRVIQGQASASGQTKCSRSRGDQGYLTSVQELPKVFQNVPKVKQGFKEFPESNKSPKVTKGPKTSPESDQSQTKRIQRVTKAI